MKRTVLVIDGSKAMRFLMQTVLGQGFQVVTASDATSALFWLSKNNTPDLIVVDPQLPDGADWEMVDFLSDSGMYRNIPMIVLSALDKHEVSFKCSEFGIAHFATKPFNPLDFLNLVHAVLEGERIPARMLRIA
jgi:CheY-like chemotaxis protein